MKRFACFCALILSPVAAWCGDWPAWRYDAQRSASSPHELPPQLHLQWVRRLPVLTPAWPDQPSMQFDEVHEPIVAGRRLFMGSSHDDSLTAYDTRTGEELWRFDANGPVRFAPLAWQDRIYFVSDDGYLYCLQAENGSLVWRFRGGPSDRMILGNGRLISTWPARGAPVIADDTIYFAAGIWPFMGVFLHALDAKTGKPHWVYDMLAAVWGSPMVIGDKVYLGDEDGDVVVLQAGPQEKLIAEMNIYPLQSCFTSIYYNPKRFKFNRNK